MWDPSSLNSALFCARGFRRRQREHIYLLDRSIYHSAVVLWYRNRVELNGSVRHSFSQVSRSGLDSPLPLNGQFCASGAFFAWILRDSSGRLGDIVGSAVRSYRHADTVAIPRQCLAGESLAMGSPASTLSRPPTSVALDIRSNYLGLTISLRIVFTRSIFAIRGDRSTKANLTDWLSRFWFCARLRLSL